MTITYYAPDEDGEMQPEGSWPGTAYCWVRREDYEALEQQLAELRRERNYLKQYVERLAAGGPIPDTPSSILAALPEEEE